MKKILWVVVVVTARLLQVGQCLAFGADPEGARSCQWYRPTISYGRGLMGYHRLEHPGDCQHRPDDSVFPEEGQQGGGVL